MSKIKEFYGRVAVFDTVMNALGDQMGRSGGHRITNAFRTHFGSWAWNRLFTHVLDKKDNPWAKRSPRYWVMEAFLVWFHVYARILLMAGDWTKAPMFHKRAKLVERR